MKSIYNLFTIAIILAYSCFSRVVAQAVDDIDIKVVGKATYGNGTPFNLALQTWGSDGNWKLYDQLKALHGQWPEKWEIGVSDTNTRSIPTNNYWSGLIFQENENWGGQNWFYPGVIEFKQTGSEVWFPNQWNDVGTSMDGGWGIVVEPESKRTFTPTKCIASDWSDWIVQTEMTDGVEKINTTFVQGMPYVWFDVSFNNITIKVHDGPYSTDGVNEINNWPYTGSKFVGNSSGRQFVVFMPPNTTVHKDGSHFTFDFATDDKYFIISFLNDPSEIDLLEEYAYHKPIDTKVDWAYNPTAAKLDVNWTVETTNLLGEEGTAVLQGFLPHHYMHTLATPNFIDLNYLTAKGTSKYAVGNSFDFSYSFTGVVPHIGNPIKQDNDYPFDSTYLAEKIEEATMRGAMGQDIYWGLKPLGRQTKYLAMAKESNHPGAEKLKKVCLSAFEDWFTYKPGETEHCFYRYDDDSNLDALVGFDPGGYSATFTDHDMCYGYMFYSAALYAMYEPEFLNDYGEFLKLLVKQINNWDRTDKDYPFFRLFEPWTGHNWAGGTGGGGNNVESLSEGMQSWAGMFILAEMMGDTAMRDAAAFGYMSMSRCFDQYYRDRDGINFSERFKPDVAAMLWTSGPAEGNYVGNEANYWMNWISYSPAMNYMFSSPEAARQQYDSFSNLYAQNSGQWGDDFWNNLNMYIQGFDAELAAEHRANNDADFQNNDLNGVSYYYLHANRFLGDIDWERHCDNPLSQVYYNSELDQYTYVCFNATDEEITVTAYEGETVIGQFNVPPHKLIQTHLDSELAGIKIEAEATIVLPGETLKFLAYGVDQYGGSTALSSSIVWSVSYGSGSITQEGEYLAEAVVDDSVVVTATSGMYQSSFVIRVGEPRRAETISVSPVFTRVPKGGVVYYASEIKDQYGDLIEGDIVWSVNGGGSMNAAMGLFESNGEAGTYIVKAEIENISYQATVVVYEPLSLTDNLALNRPAASDTYQNRAASANDGQEGSQWQSNGLIEDGGELLSHWWSVELDNVYEIHALEVLWDVSATSYTIQYSLDGNNWVTADSITGSNWWTTDEIDLYLKGINAKFLRVYCYLHDGDYGYAIKEFRSFGEVATGPSVLATLIINPSVVENLQLGSSVQYNVIGYDEDGKKVDLEGVWSVSGGGSINQEGVFLAEALGGPFDIKYEQTEVVANAAVKVVPQVITSLNADNKPSRVVFDVIPNPVSDKLQFKIKDGEFIESYSVINANGVEVLKGNNQQIVNVSHFKSGVYLVKVKTIEGGVFSQSFVKK